MWLLGACRKCRGDLIPEWDEWKCIQCGDRRYPNPINLDDPHVSRRGPDKLKLAETHAKWTRRNAGIIEVLKKGLSAREVATMFGKTARYVRRIRELVGAE